MVKCCTSIHRFKFWRIFPTNHVVAFDDTYITVSLVATTILQRFVNLSLVKIAKVKSNDSNLPASGRMAIYIIADDIRLVEFWWKGFVRDVKSQNQFANTFACCAMAVHTGSRTVKVTSQQDTIHICGLNVGKTDRKLMHHWFQKAESLWRLQILLDNRLKLWSNNYT